MTLGETESVNGVPIRLTDERWTHILDDHQEFSASDMELLLDAVEWPNYILRGRAGSFIAVLILGKASYLHVVYKELSEKDGFIITAGIRPIVNKKSILWRR